MSVRLDGTVNKIGAVLQSTYADAVVSEINSDDRTGGIVSLERVMSEDVYLVRERLAFSRAANQCGVSGNHASKTRVGRTSVGRRSSTRAWPVSFHSRRDCTKMVRLSPRVSVHWDQRDPSSRLGLPDRDRHSYSRVG